MHAPHIDSLCVVNSETLQMCKCTIVLASLPIYSNTTHAQENTALFLFFVFFSIELNKLFGVWQADMSKQQTTNDH